MKSLLLLMGLLFSFSILNAQDEKIWDINDSLKTIPCYDLYCSWNNVSIHPYKNDFTKIEDSINIKITNDSCDFSAPVVGKVNSQYGWRGSRPHYGLDIKITYGDSIFSIFDGVVRIAKYSKSYGHVIVIRHNNGIETLYAHLTKRKLKVGDQVNSGDLVGLGGCTGRCSGAHLHLETRYLGEAFDPELIFDVSDSTFALREENLILDKTDFVLQKKARSVRYYTVRRGDTLYAIARREGASITKLCQINDISRNSTLRIGQRLRVN